MSSKTTSFILLKSQKYRTCYAGRGLRSGTPRWGYPSHRYRGGPLPFTEPRAATPLRRPLLASHVGMMIFQRLVTHIWHWPKQIVPNDAAANYDVSRQTELHLRDKSTRNLWDVLPSGQSPLFSTLLATAVQCYTLTIRKLADSINVKRQVWKEVLAWAFG